jgi:transposase
LPGGRAARREHPAGRAAAVTAPVATPAGGVAEGPARAPLGCRAEHSIPPPTVPRAAGAAAADSAAACRAAASSGPPGARTAPGWARFLEFCRYLRSLYPSSTRIAIICDNFSPHLSTRKDTRVGTWATANNVEIAYTPTNSSWLNRIEAQFTALRYFALDGTDHASHTEQASMIRRYIIWRNNHAYDERLRRIVDKANVA